MELISRKEIARCLNLTPNTVWTYTRNGIIPAFKVGSQLRYDLNAVVEALKKYEPKTSNQCQ